MRGYLNLKMSGVDEGPVISTDVRLALILYTPISQNMEAHIVFALFVISFEFFFFFFFFCFFFFSQGLEPLFLGKDIKNLI